MDSDSDNFDVHDLLESALKGSQSRVRAHKNFNIFYVLSQVAAILSLILLIIMRW